MATPEHDPLAPRTPADAGGIPDPAEGGAHVPTADAPPRRAHATPERDGEPSDERARREER